MMIHRLWLRLELRRRWRSLAVLALLVALAAGTVLTSLAGARRGDSSVERLQARTLPADAVVLPNQPGFDWDKIRALPEVTAISTFLVADTPVEGIPEESQGFPPADTDAMTTVERPVVLKGRLADQSRVDEIVVSANFVHTYHKGVGDPLTIHLYTPRQVNASSAGEDVGAPLGPRIPAHIVGVVRSPFASDQVGAPGGLVPTAALFTHYRANFVGTSATARNSVFINALVRLRGGESALPKFRADLARVTGRNDIDVWNQADKAAHTQKVNSFESGCLLAFAIAALVAAFVLVGQSVARYTAATVVDLQILRAVGMTPRQTLVGAVIGPFLAAAAGATVGVAGAIVASNWMPIGNASTWEPSPGIDVDWAILGTGWLVVPLVVLAGAAISGWLALAAGRARVSPRRSTVAVAAARAGLPVPVVVGARFALEPGRGRSAVPVRPALLGAVVGVLGVLAAFTFSAGVSDAVGHPERFGQTHQLETFLGENGVDYGAGPGEPSAAPRILRTVAKDRDVTAVNDARIAVAESGNASVTMYTYASVRAPKLPIVLTNGHVPHATNDVVLAPTSAQRLGAHVGSAVRFAGSHGAYTMRVSGIGFVPEGPHNGYADGGWVTPGGYDRLFSGFKFHEAEIVLRPGADITATAARLTKAVSPIAPVAFGPPFRPAEISEIEDVRILPIVLGGFLFLLALGAVGHALATAVRRRRHDMAVLRALGMTRWQSRGVVVTQATILAAVGVIFGVPLGLALARVLWHQVADNTPIAYHPPLAVWALLLIVPLALLLANLLAAWPGHRAARIQVGQTLRTE
jgi:hypothetical protein